MDVDFTFRVPRTSHGFEPRREAAKAAFRQELAARVITETCPRGKEQPKVPYFEDNTPWYPAFNNG
jgi:hypothetical protein